MDRYILASQSPRRRELLASVIMEYEVIPAKGDENAAGGDPAEVVRRLSYQKASEVAAGVEPCGDGRVIVIGADTVVAVDGRILGKPADRADAERMIGMIQGREHHVYTGVTVCWREADHEAEQEACYEAEQEETQASERGGMIKPERAAVQSFTFSEETAVEVFPMSSEEIEAYVSLQEPYDKAGAYGIQGAFCVFIKGIRGDYNNVVGLPVARLYHEMAARGLVEQAICGKRGLSQCPDL